VGVRTLRDLETGRTARPQRSTVELLATALALDATEREDFVVASRGWPGASRVPRQRTQQAVLASWRLLTPTEQDGLSWLAAFPGRWTLDLATALLRERKDTSGPAPAELIEHLVGLGLVSTMPGQPRYWVRDAVRLFISDRAESTLALARDAHLTLMGRLESESETDGLSAGRSGTTDERG
jgi:hypothetical protein